tara:strand:- start:63 stop:1175 length:1113 start_codon:yes stop_codon:yes gene_type:complete
MRLILFFSYGVSLNDWKKSGLFEREIKFYKYLKNTKNIDISFVTYGDNGDMRYENELEGIHIIPIYSEFKKHKNKVFRILCSLIYGYRLRKKFRKQKYIIKTNQLWGAWVAIVFKIFSKNTLIVRTGYDLVSFKLRENKSSFKILLYLLLTQIALIFSKKYTVTSNEDKAFLYSKKFIHKNKITVIPNWIDTKEIDLPERKKGYISIGRFEKQKNFKMLIETFAEINKEITLIGEGSLKKDLEKLSDSLDANINFLGILNNDDVLNLLSEHKYYIHTSYYEGNPKTILEAMSVGCIVIVPNNPNIEEIVENNINGLVYDLKKDDLIAVIQSAEKKDLEVVSKNAISYINQNNSLEKILKLEYNIYQEILN